MLANLAALVVASAFSNKAVGSTSTAKESHSPMKSVRTYLGFSQNVDPASIVTMADLEISMALASPLVAFDNERQVVAALAQTWTILPPNKIIFTLRANLKWSDGSPITAGEYKRSLERARIKYGPDLKALFDTIETIQAKDDRTLEFTTKGDVAKSGLLLKLTEPMYGLLATSSDDLDLSKSSGPFVLKNKSADELTLASNSNWYAHESEMPALVEIRRPNGDQGTIGAFENDSWPNLVSVSSLMSTEIHERLKGLGYKTWQRSLDKVYGLFASKRFLREGGAAVMRKLARDLDRAALLNGVSGYAVADQFFPRGYILYSSQPAKIEQSELKKRDRIKIAAFLSPTLGNMMKELEVETQKISKATVLTDAPPVAKSEEILKKGDFDILAMSLAVADPNFEGAMSFYIEREPPMIQSTPGEMNFAEQMRVARGLPSSDQRAEKMRAIMLKAQEAGFFVPLFHFSSLAVAKPGLDLSQVPNSDEIVPFAKVRMR